jgi:hypothetical protein
VRAALPAEEVAAAPHLAEARRLREAGRLHDSLEAYRQVVRLCPGCAEARARVAEDDVRHGRREPARDAVKDLEHVDDPHPPWVRAQTRLLRGYLLDLAGAREDAVKVYKQVLDEPYGDAALAREAKARIRRPFSVEISLEAPRP